MQKVITQIFVFSLLTILLSPIAAANLVYSASHEQLSSNIQQLDVVNEHAAHWLTLNTVLLTNANKQLHYELISIDNNKVSSWPLTPTRLSPALAKQYPHLQGYSAYKLTLSSLLAKQLLKTKLRVIAKRTQAHQKSYVTGVQTGDVIDELYTRGVNDANEITDLGATLLDGSVQFKLWAPTARSVSVLVYQDDELVKKLSAEYKMVEESHSGTWQLTTKNVQELDYYQYKIEVYHPASQQVETLITTDPYSLSLSTNSKYSQVVDLNRSITQPIAWRQHKIPSVNKPEDNILYETHIRDFSANDFSLADPSVRGKYLAFKEDRSNGIKHLKALQKAGLNNIHLLPAFDIGTVNEHADQVIDIDDTVSKLCRFNNHVSICQDHRLAKKTIRAILASYDVNSSKAQKLVSEIRQLDNYNWGYDPFHYTVPEGSYATNAMGIARIIEFREMVKRLHELGFRVIMDVVYNHTHQYGLATNSVLDKVVPGYYHRLNPLSGVVEQSTCYTCGNTATERVMMEKLMIDSLVTWAREYKIDGFRFDLMGHQPKRVMLKARAAVRKVDPDTYFYGEGWNFGEVANNQRFVQASQLELGGTEIGTFTDRLRDAVRGGGNNTRDTQGIGNGLLTMPNEQQTSTENITQYNLLIDQLRIGLAGNLALYDLSGNNTKLGRDIPYGDQPTGYAHDPADTINYVSKHDNQTLWDNSQYRLPFSASVEERVRMHNLSLSFALYAQGIPFIHMGSELLRSKSFLRDSYDYGDWFNAVDFSMQTNNYHVGLPPADKDQANWPLIQKVLAGHRNHDNVTAKEIQFSSEVFKEMLAIRTSSELFRLATAEQIQAKVSFLNQHNQPGLVVMMLDDNKGKPIDNRYHSIIVIFNTNNDTAYFNYDKAKQYQLHSVQKKGVDDTAKTSSRSKKGFIIAPLTTAVFVKTRE